MQTVMAGPDLRDIASLPRRRRLSARPRGIEGWRIAVSPDLGFFEIDAEVASKTRTMATVLEELGAEVETVALPWTAQVFEAALPCYRSCDPVEPKDRRPERAALLRDYLRRDAEYFAGRAA